MFYISLNLNSVKFSDNENELLSTTSIDKEYAFHFKTITCKILNQLDAEYAYFE